MNSKAIAKPKIRCAIYTRKSTEEGLEKEFNSLDAQRESATAYIASQQHEGWICLKEHYDDGGFTGGNMERPALQRLLVDIAAGKIDCVTVYKVDRLSRSLLDFARMMEVFQRHNVAFVSVTQHFNTATSMGRLVLNVLLSFAQFEREIISERTRDKIAATRRKGKWSGGHSILGYDVDPRTFKLVVNEAEAERVRQILALYLRHGTLVAVVEVLAELGWTNKQWRTRKGRDRGGQPFGKSSLHKLLTNVAYLGKVRYKTEIHPGEHQAIVEESLWRQVQASLCDNRQSATVPRRTGAGGLLKGMVHCSGCGSRMSHTHATKNGTARYRYYRCTNTECGTARGKYICAAAVECFVTEQIQLLAKDQPVEHSSKRRLANGIEHPNAQEPGIAKLFDGTWEALPRQEQRQVLRTLVDRINLNVESGDVAIQLQPEARTVIANALASRREIL